MQPSSRTETPRHQKTTSTSCQHAEHNNTAVRRSDESVFRAASTPLHRSQCPRAAPNNSHLRNNAASPPAPVASTTSRNRRQLAAETLTLICLWSSSLPSSAVLRRPRGWLPAPPLWTPPPTPAREAGVARTKRAQKALVSHRLRDAG